MKYIFCQTINNIFDMKFLLCLTRKAIIQILYVQFFIPSLLPKQDQDILFSFTSINIKVLSYVIDLYKLQFSQNPTDFHEDNNTFITYKFQL